MGKVVGWAAYGKGIVSSYPVTFKVKPVRNCVCPVPSLSTSASLFRAYPIGHVVEVRCYNQYVML